MVTVLPKEDNGWGRALGGVAEAATGAYVNHADEKALQKSIASLPPNASARQILDTITNTNTYSPKAKQNALKNYLGVAEFEELKRKTQKQEEISENKLKAVQTEKLQKENQDREKVGLIVDSLESIPEEQKEPLRKSLSLADAGGLLKEEWKNKNKPDIFEKRIQEKNADQYIKLSEEIPKLESILGDIGRVEQLSNNLGVKGMIGGALGVSAAAAELEGMGFTIIEPIFKLLAPTGPLAQYKVKEAKDKFAIKPTDSPWKRQGKINAIKRFGKQAVDRAKKKMELIKKYNGKIPPAIETEYEKESETIIDAALDYDLVGEEVNIPGMPPASQYKDTEVDGPGGEVYYSDGERWIKK